jgi:hypothetical protein
MALKDNGRLSRRQALKALTMATSGAALSPLLSACRMDQFGPEQEEKTGYKKEQLNDGKPKFLITLCATGGASIVDSFLAVRNSECPNTATLNTFPDADVATIAGSPFRAVRYSASAMGAIPIPVNTDQTAFVNKHKAEMLVATNLGTSVNHVIAQKRSITGNGAWKGRTLQECVALQYGAGFPLPNVNMSVGGYIERGVDDTLPAWAYAETLAQPALWPLGLDGVKGLKGVPDRSLVELARKLRNEKLDPESVFAQTFQKSDRLKRWYDQRGQSQQSIEALDLITKLNILPDTPPQIPLTEYGLGVSPDATALRTRFPNFFTDPVEGQAALAFLLLKYRVSCAVTLSPTFNVVIAGSQLGNPPLAFDFSHQDHRGAQAFMWSKMLSLVDRLSDLLKAEPFAEAPGQSLWDRTMIYIATDFGRTRTRLGGTTNFSSGHDMNNGIVMFSPMVDGNRILGSVDPLTTYTRGFNPETGVTDLGVISNERDNFAGILHTLGVDTSGSGLPDARAYRKLA